MNFPSSTLERSSSGPERSVGADVHSDESWDSAKKRAPWEQEVELAGLLGEDYTDSSGGIVRGKVGTGQVAGTTGPFNKAKTTSVAFENEPSRQPPIEDSRWTEKTVLQAGDIGSVLQVSWAYGSEDSPSDVLNVPVGPS